MCYLHISFSVVSFLSFFFNFFFILFYFILLFYLAIQLCKATGYRSAGTVEMLCDSKQNFYFLEMNTRLQVEHPVTELVGKEDLVELMLLVAAGNPLPDRLITNPFVPIQGWSIESRVYAEDPLRGFLPSIGPLLSYQEPESYKSDKEIVRVDSGIYEGGQISMYYDPMISKLATWAPDRDAAIAVMEKALDQYVIRGLGHNLSFCRDVMRNEVFRSGNYSTKFIEEQYPDGFKGVNLNYKETNELIALAATIHLIRNEGFRAKEVTSVQNVFVERHNLSMCDKYQNTYTKLYILPYYI